MASNGERQHLLRTKLYRPRVADHLVHRPRVCEILDRNVDRALTLVCAPAGFGKTTLLSDWLEGCPLPNAWLSLDEHDGDVSAFLSYFVAAIRTIFAHACADTLALLQSPALPPMSLLANTLANDLDGLTDDPALADGGRFILVLDDYHLVRGPAVHALLSELLRHPPRCLHLVLSARQDPPFPLHLLRGRGELGEIRVRELRFTGQEVAVFMQQALGKALDEEALEILAERTEGWVTGLRLAAITLDAGGDVAGPELAADNRNVLDYLLNEVLEHVPAATQDFLLKTAILERLCGTLCDAVAGPVAADWDGSAYLEWLAAQNLFTFALDAQGTWYRYHQLFRTLLHNRMERRYSAEEIAAVNARASAWFAQNGFIEEAIRHALEAGDESVVVRLVEEHRHAAMNQEDWRLLERWLRLMPQRLIDMRPELLLLETWLLQNQWQLGEIAARLDRIEVLLAQEPRPEPERTRLGAEVDVLRSMAYFFALDWERSSACAKRALLTAPLTYSTVRGNAWLYYAIGLYMTGGDREGLAALGEGLKEDRHHGNAFPTRPYTGMCLIHWMDADLTGMALAATQMLQFAQQRNLSEATGLAHYFMGCASYQLNDLDGAEREFTTVVRQGYIAHAFAFSQSAFGLASIFQVRGEDERACELADSVVTYGLEMNHSRILNDAEAFRAWLDLTTGALAKAQRWSSLYEPNARPMPMSTFHVATLSLAKVLLGVRTPSSLERAAEVLARLHDTVQTTHNTRFLVEVMALTALLHDARGNSSAALAALEQAVRLSEPGGAIRVFVDFGPKMAALLRQLATRSLLPEYLGRLLDAFGDVKLPQSLPFWAGPEQERLIEPLSDRELEVLALLAERQTNKEIARALFISAATVKRHTVNIYQKLGVGSRRDAVTKAQALGLIPPPRPR